MKCDSFVFRGGIEKYDNCAWCRWGNFIHPSSRILTIDFYLIGDRDKNYWSKWSIDTKLSFWAHTLYIPTSFKLNHFAANTTSSGVTLIFLKQLYYYYDVTHGKGARKEYTSEKDRQSRKLCLTWSIVVLTFFIPNFLSPIQALLYSKLYKLWGKSLRARVTCSRYPPRSMNHK